MAGMLKKGQDEIKLKSIYMYHEKFEVVGNEWDKAIGK